MYINNANNRLSGDIDLGQEIDFSKIIENGLPKDFIKVPTDTKQNEKPKILQVRQEEVLEPISDCNKTTWKYGIAASCLAIYFGLPLLFGNK